MDKWGFFVCEPQIFNYIEEGNSIFEKRPIEKLVADNQLMAFKHTGYWKPMDTLRDKIELEESWESGNAPWKNW